ATRSGVRRSRRPLRSTLGTALGGSQRAGGHRPGSMRGPMLFRRFYYEPLAQACYVLGDGREAIVIDPPRDASEILAFLAEQRLRCTHMLGTHVHADFVTGLGEVAAATGARIGLGARFTGRLPCERLDDGAELHFGDATLRVLHTPGHTPE